MFRKRKEAFESRDLKVNRLKTKVMVNKGIMEDGLSLSNVCPYGICGLMD